MVLRVKIPKLATVAQPVEQLIRNQQVGSSNLLGGSKDSSDTSPGSFFVRFSAKTYDLRNAP